MVNNSAIVFTLVCIAGSFHAFAMDINSGVNAYSKTISESNAKRLLNDQKNNLKKAGIFQDIEPDSNSFELNVKSKKIYIISGTRKSKTRNNLHRCAILLFDADKQIKSVLDTVAPKDDESFWTCDGTAAMSFRDFYADGNPEVIVLYNITPPSNERFILPVILKLDLKKPSLEIDEPLTGILEEADVNTIQEVRSFLKKQLQKR